MRNLLTLSDVTATEIERVFAITEDLKTKFGEGVREPLLPGRVLALLFEKPSLRTRVSFEAAMAHLGGGSLFLGSDVGWGKREALSDFAQVLSEYADAVVCRAKSHTTVAQLARYSACPVINGLTDLAHPCQALTDLYTLRELYGPLAGQKLCYIGDANNVARSLAVACGKLRVELSIAAPEGYQFAPEFLKQLADETPDLKLHQTRDPREAARNANAIYTDVWASMGQEAEQAQRARAFADFQVNQSVMDAAPKDACFLHCLPARRGEEVSDEVIDGPQSQVVRQAGNRMHVQKGLLAWLLGSQK